MRLWRWSLDSPPEREAELWRSLSTDERDKADRFVTHRLRSHSIAARGGLRLALGRLLNVDPGELRFFYGRHGKPMLADTEPRLHFNLSHSAGTAVLATHAADELGIDIEQVGLLPVELLDRLALGERRQLLATPDTDRTRAFFACWTRKEAFAKAIGLGLNLPFDRFDVLSTVGKVEHGGHGWPDPSGSWRTVSFDPGCGLVGAVALRGDIPLEAVPVELF